MQYRRTALYDVHKAQGARFTHFAGWEMPVSYSGITAEHNAVRTAAGLFDVSHMGEFLVWGESALDLLQHLTINDVARLEVGQAQYSAMASPAGTLLDDILVYRLDAGSYMVVVNAANREKDWAWFRAHNRFGASIEDASDRTALLALQGPHAAEILGPLTELDLTRIGYYRCARARVSDVECVVSRTGYTGEDGFEFYFPPEHSAPLWQAFLESGADLGLAPAGLGARNTLRLEAAMLLYGNDIDETVTPLEAGLDRFTRLEKEDFIGRESLRKQRETGIGQKLVGFRMRGTAIARDGYEVRIDGRPAGRVTSAGPSITLRKNIGLAYLPVESASEGTRFQICVRRSLGDAEVVSTPFYKRRVSV